MRLLSRIKIAVTERISDYRRERMIRACEALVKDTNNSREKRQIAFAMMAEMIRERSPKRVERMERVRGLISISGRSRR